MHPDRMTECRRKLHPHGCACDMAGVPRRVDPGEGSDADIVAAILGVTRDRRGCGIPKHRIDDWTATLRGDGYMLAVEILVAMYVRTW